MPDKLKFRQVMSYVYSIVFGIACVVIIDYFWMKTKNEHLPVLLSLAGGIIGFVAKVAFDYFDKRIEQKMDKAEFLAYREADKNIHEELMALMEDVKKKQDIILSKLIN